MLSPVGGNGRRDLQSSRYGASGQTRTDDLSLTKRLLCQLSYKSILRSIASWLVLLRPYTAFPFVLLPNARSHRADTPYVGFATPTSTYGIRCWLGCLLLLVPIEPITQYKARTRRGTSLPATAKNISSTLCHPSLLPESGAIPLTSHHYGFFVRFQYILQSQRRPTGCTANANTAAITTVTFAPSTMRFECLPPNITAHYRLFRPLR